MHDRRAFTLVELLVVITIIGILMSLLMPSLASMRESGRRVQCQNNLKQISLAFNAHVATHVHYPTGGWSYYWVGDPDLGFGIKQPGGWLYNILPFLDLQPIHDMGKGLSRAAKMQPFCDRAQIPIPIFNCPTRRRAATYPFASSATNYNAPRRAARTDYAANGGSTMAGWGAPRTLSAVPSDAALAQYAANVESYSTGIVHGLSEITPAHVRDGLGCTYMVAEKHLKPDNYTNGSDPGDNESLFMGDDQDVARWVITPPLRDTNVAIGLNADKTPVDDSSAKTQLSKNFGSAHAAGFYAAFCDGSVRLVGFSIDPAVHAALGTRDGAGRKNAATLQEESPVDQAQIP